MSLHGTHTNTQVTHGVLESKKWKGKKTAVIENTDKNASVCLSDKMAEEHHHHAPFSQQV